MKNKIKKMFRIISIIVCSPFIAFFYAFSFITKGRKNDDLFAAFSQFFSLLPGTTGVYLRIGFYRFVMNHCHENVHISFGTLLSQVDTDIGTGVYIGPQCNIGKCTIGEETLIGSGVHIMSGKHQHNFDDLEKPIRIQGGQYDKIHIGRNCWIGNAALILASVGDDCIIAAGSVVVNDIANKSIVAGNPAKVIKTRQ